MRGTYQASLFRACIAQFMGVAYISALSRKLLHREALDRRARHRGECPKSSLISTEPGRLALAT